MRYITLLTFCIASVSVICTSLPMFRAGFFRPHDFTHAARIVEMHRSLTSGEFPVRWSENFGFGYGMPLFNFYAPLPYYIAQVPYVLTTDPIIALRVLFVLQGGLSFVGMYLLTKRIFADVLQRHGATLHALAILSAVAFVVSTYRAVDIYVRGALGEAYAMAGIPFVLYGLSASIVGKRNFLVLTAVALAWVLLSHNLTGMITVGVICGYACVYAFAVSRHRAVSFVTLLRTALLSLFLSLSLGVGLSAFYVLPAFFEKDYTRVEQTITTGYFEYHRHFVALRQFVMGTWGYGGSVEGLEDGMSFALGAVPLALTMASAVYLLFTLLRGPRVYLYRYGIPFLFLAASAIMATNKSILLWEQITLLKFVQFPWRFLAFVHVFLSLCVGIWLAAFKQPRIVVTLCVVACLLLIAAQAKFFVPEAYLEDPSTYYATDPMFIRTTVSETLNDYLPPSVVGDDFPPPATTKVEVLEGKGVARVQTQASNALLADIVCEQHCIADIKLFPFPGWSATVDGRRSELTTQGAYGNYQVQMPAGRHVLRLYLQNTPVRTIGNLVSVLSLLALCYLAYTEYRYAHA